MGSTHAVSTCALPMVGAVLSTNLPVSHACDGLDIMTANVTCAANLKLLLQATDVHVICAQEIKLSADELEDMSQWCLMHRWKFLACPMLIGPKGGRSAGVAIVVRDVFGLLPCSPLVVCEGRAIAATLQLPDGPQFRLISLYLETRVGMSPSNKRLLAAAGQCLMASDVPGILAGDFNCSPSVVLETGFAQLIHGHVIAPEGPTYISGDLVSCIDYFAVTGGVVRIVDALKAVPSLCFPNHYEVRMRLRTTTSRCTMKKLWMPPAIPTLPPFGPRPCPPDWHGAQAAASQAETMALKHQHTPFHVGCMRAAISAAYRAVMNVLELELVGITGTFVGTLGRRTDMPRIITTSIFPCLANPNAVLSCERLDGSARALRC